MDNKQQAPIGVVLECKVQSGHVEMPDGAYEWKEVRNWRVEVVSEIYLEPGTGVYTTPPAQPTPANLWLYWKVDDKSVITGPFKTHSKVEAYGLGCIDQTPLTVPAAQVLAVQEPVIQRVMSRLADLLDEDQFKEIEGMVVVAGCTPPTQPAAQPAAPLTAWQPIETAPRDGRWVITFDGETVSPNYYLGSEIEHWAKTPLLVNPTHWMPIPAAPKKGQP
jgi:hypothetical protein